MDFSLCLALGLLCELHVWIGKGSGVVKAPRAGFEVQPRKPDILSS